jgi:NADPH2:quinone reductase
MMRPMTTCKAVMLTKKGGPEVLEVVEVPVVEPGAGEVRIAVRATGAGGTDVTMRRGTYPYAPPIPFVPGYEVVGDVEAVGPGVTTLRVGQRVAALLVHGGYAEKVVRRAEEFVPVPDGLGDAEAVALILNYVTAYQAIHRSAKVQAGQRVLVTGANGGVGSAALELLREAGATAYGAASAKNHDMVRALGATPVEGRAGPVDVALRAVCPEGVDAALDGLGGDSITQCIRATRKMERWVLARTACVGGRRVRCRCADGAPPPGVPVRVHRGAAARAPPPAGQQLAALAGPRPRGVTCTPTR